MTALPSQRAGDCTLETLPPQCTLEAVPKVGSASYAYSIPDNPASYAATANRHYYYDHTTNPAPITTENTPKSPRNRRIKPLAFGLLIAIIALVAGGAIGYAISNSLHKTPGHGNEADATPNCPVNTTSSSNIATPTSSSPIFQRTLPIPTTGCNDANNLQDYRTSFTEMSTYLSTPYTVFCQTGWTHDDLFAASVATPSDCVESCVWYNKKKGSEDRTCIGGGYIPEWWNQTKAMDEDDDRPYNCFLKSKAGSVFKNDRVIEVVSLCLGGEVGYCGGRRIE
jgi:hypothetical protein